MALVFLSESTTKLVANAAIAAMQEEVSERFKMLRFDSKPEENYRAINDLCNEMANIARQLAEQAKEKTNEVKF